MIHPQIITLIGLMFCWFTLVAQAIDPTTVESNRVAEVTLASANTYENPFTEIELTAIVTRPDGKTLKVPMFWKGGENWSLRYASNILGKHTFKTECSDAKNKKLHGIKGSIEVTAYQGENQLYQHGMFKISEDNRHFAHYDGTPFFWLADTWWKCLAKRLTWDGFQELAQDRKAKGFSVVQIVAGPYPDEGPREPMWENEGGLMYETDDFTVMNPEYWTYADRRFEYLIDTEIAPAIVGAWGRADCDAMKHVGVDGLKRHWRYLIARYGAYPVFWMLAGELHNESKWGVGPWGEVGRYVREIDPYQHPITIHSGSGREDKKGDDLIISFDMVGGSHTPEKAISTDVAKILIDTYKKEPTMPVLMGESCYEGHMQNGFQYLQRHIFWMYMLSGAAGHTYGAAGIWHASVEGDAGCASSAFGGRKVYDWTTWREGMTYKGATQVGLGKKLLEQYPWEKFEPHPEWAEEGSYAAGIPGKVHFIYQPKRGIYDWNGSIVRNLEMNVAYTAYYFDPASGRRFENGKVEIIDGGLGDLTTHTQALLYVDDFDRQAVGFKAKGNASDWKDYGTATQRKNGVLIGKQGVLSILETVKEKDVVVSCASVKNNAEAGLVLRFHDSDNYIAATYNSEYQLIIIYEKKDGEWGSSLGRLKVSGIASEFKMTAAASGEYVTLIVADKKKTWRTNLVKVNNTTAGKTGLWFDEDGEGQEFGRFEVSPMSLQEQGAKGLYLAPDLPSPQDWILVLEKVEE